MPAPWIVLKFGGTSVSTRARLDTIGSLSAARQREAGHALVVVSAVSGVTNQLQAAAEGQLDAARVWQTLATKHREYAQDLGVADFADLHARLSALEHLLLGDARSRTHAFEWQAEVLAQGELLSSTLVCAYLQAQGLQMRWLDARDWLTALALPNASAWSDRLSVNCDLNADDAWRAQFAQAAGTLAITQGFIARHPQGNTAILGRGGSDTSAACFGARLQAKRVEIWTDVPGMFSANPREVPDARLLARLDYAEAQEIATTGAKVLHPRAITPCREAGVPLYILDTEQPQLPGTRIAGDARAVPGVKAITRRNGIVLVSMESIGMWQQVGFLADVFERFRRHGLSVDLIGSSETNVTVSLDPSENLVSTDVLAQLSTDLAEVCRVKVIAPCAAITLVGRGMRSLLDKLSDVWATFGRERVHLISQSSNDLNLTFVVDEVDADGMVETLHGSLIASGAMPVAEREVFGPRWSELLGEIHPKRAPAWWQARDAAHQLLAVAAQGTPVYAYHLPTLKHQLATLNAVAAIDARFYAMKANAHPELLRTIVSAGFGLECVSYAEIEHAFTHVPGLGSAQVLFTPSFAPPAEIEAALARGVTVTLDNVEFLTHHPDMLRGKSIWLRIDLGHGDGHHAKVVTGGEASKFGLDLQRLDEFLAAARALDVRITGLHAHLGSGIDNRSHWRGVYAELVAIADRIGTVASIDIGGGLPIPYTPDAQAFDVAGWAQGLSELKNEFPRYKLVIEPGRYVVAQCGVLLAQVTQVVEKSGVRRVGLDAGMNSLMRPALYGAWHAIVNLSRAVEEGETAPTLQYDVVGPICESGDVLAHARSLHAATAPGDVLLVADAGAYGMSMANTYNLRALPREEIVR